MHLKLPFLLLRPLLLLLLASGAVYMAAGVAYGRSKQPPLDGDGAFAHPEGQGAITWHPHYELWGQGRMLVLDGWRYTKVSGHRNLPVQYHAVIGILLVPRAKRLLCVYKWRYASL